MSIWALEEILFHNIIPMDCGVNMRSLNGIPVGNNRVVADGLFYRGPEPAVFLNSDHDIFRRFDHIGRFTGMGVNESQPSAEVIG